MLVTRRLILRDMRDEDAECLSAYQSDASYLVHYATPPDARAIVASAIEWAIESPRIDFQLAIVLASTDAVIGCAGLRQRGYPTGEAEIGIEIDPSLWRRGFAREALRALIDLGVSELSLTSFWGCTARSNYRAQALVEEFGFAEYDVADDIVRLRLSFDASPPERGTGRTICP